MERMLLWLLAIVLVVASVILHVFYIDYQSAAKEYIFSWPANNVQRAKVIGREAGELVRPSVTRADYAIVGARMKAHEERWCRPTPAYYRVKGSQRYFIGIDQKEYWHCDVEFDRKQAVKDATRTIPGVTPGQALATVSKAYEGREILHGMVPGAQVRGGDRASTALWLGILAPLGLFVAAILAAAAALRRPAKANLPAFALAPAEPVQSRSTHARTASMADSLRARYGAHFPVATGNGTFSDPLVITERRDYVDIEYAVVRHALEDAGEEFQLEWPAPAARRRSPYR